MGQLNTQREFHPSKFSEGDVINRAEGVAISLKV